MTSDAYFTAIADQIQAAADDDDAIGDILDRVNREQGPRAAAALTLAALEHADACRRAKSEQSAD